MTMDTHKAKKFLEAINCYAEKQRNQICTENKNYKKQQLEKAEKEILKDAVIFIKKQVALVRAATARELSNEETAGRHKLFQKRNHITQKVFQRAEAMLKDFTKTEEYIAFLKKATAAIADLTDNHATVLFLRGEDLHFAKDLASLFKNGCTVQSSNEITIGGIKAINFKMAISLDETLDTRLAEQYDWFISHCGLEIRC